MDTFVESILGVAWFAIAVMLLWGLADWVRKALSSPTRLPFFRMLERQGLTLTQVEEVVGFKGLARAVRRCVRCSKREACESALVGGWLGRKPPVCPNEKVFWQARGLA
jgi:hypothetical protein